MMFVTTLTTLAILSLRMASRASAECDICANGTSVVDPGPAIDLYTLQIPELKRHLRIQSATCAQIARFSDTIPDASCGPLIQRSTAFQAACCREEEFVVPETVVCNICEGSPHPLVNDNTITLPNKISETVGIFSATCGALNTLGLAGDTFTASECGILQVASPFLCCPEPQKVECNICDKSDHDLGNLGALVEELPFELQFLLDQSSDITTCASINNAASQEGAVINDYRLTEEQCSVLQTTDDVINLCCPEPPEVLVPSTGKSHCFSGRSTVQVQGKGETRIDQLQIGDAVQQLDGSYSTVYSFAHRAPEQMVEYLQIHTTQSKKPLEISKEHMLYANGHLVPAKKVKVGDELLVTSNKDGGTTIGATVTKIGHVSLIGAYAPYTTTGTLVVSGVATSSYVAADEFSSFLTPVQQHSFQQIINGPHRLLYNLGWLGEETYDNAFGFSQSMMLQRSMKFFFLQYFSHLASGGRD